MSYILEALRKAEQERNLGRVPDLNSVPVLALPPRRRLWPWLVGLSLGLFVLGNGVVWVLYLRSAGEAGPALQSSTLASPVPPPASQVTQSTEPKSTEPKSTEPKSTEPKSTEPKSTEPKSTEPKSTEPKSTESLEPAPLATHPPPVRTADTQPTVTGLDDEPPARKPASAKSPPPETPVAAAEPPPPLQVMPAEFRRSMPSLNLDVHVYSESPAQRFVLINTRHYREGEKLNEGPLLETITADGAVLDYRGKRFLLPVHR